MVNSGAQAAGQVLIDQFGRAQLDHAQLSAAVIKARVVGPDGALYVAEGVAGRISRVNPKTGAITPFASGLPKAIVDFGGPVDVAFLGETAYALVTLVEQTAEAPHA